MTKLSYRRRWINRAFGGAWTSYNTTRAITAIVVPLVLSPFIKQYIPALEPYMSDLLWQIPSAALALFFAGRVFLTPGWLNQEREQEIEKFEQQLHNHALRQTQCDAIANLIDEGRRVQELYAKEGITPTTNEAEVWQDKVRTYLKENFGRASVTQWENDDGLSLPESPRDKLNVALALRAESGFLPMFFYQSEQSKIHQTLIFRLIRLHELLTRLQERLI